MYEEVIITFFLGIACIACFGAFYDNVVRPILRDELRFRLFALRDELRWKASIREVDPKSKFYRELEKSLCRFIDNCFLFTWQKFIIFLFAHGKEADSSEALDFHANAPSELRRIQREACSIMLMVLGVNSPVVNRLLLFIFRGRKKKAKIDHFFQDPDALDGDTRQIGELAHV